MKCYFRQNMLLTFFHYFSYADTLYMHVSDATFLRVPTCHLESHGPELVQKENTAPPSYL